MGSESVTVKGISSSNVIPDNYRLFQKTLINTALNMNSINTKDIHDTLLRGIINMFSTFMLINKGLLHPIDLSIQQTDADKIVQWVAEEIDENITSLVYYGDYDENNKQFYYEPIRYIWYIENEYDSYSLENYIEWSDTYYIGQSHPVQEVKIKIGSIEIDDKRYVPKIDSDTNKFVIDTDNNLITLINIEDDTDEIQIDYPTITIRYIGAFWKTDTDDDDDTLEYNSAFIARTNIETPYLHRVFAIPLKMLEHGNLDDYKFILNKYNLKKDLMRDDPDEDDLYDTYNNDEYTNILFGYISKFGYLNEYIESFYGTPTNRYEVKIEITDRYSSNKLGIRYNKSDDDYYIQFYTIFDDGQIHDSDDGDYGKTSFSTFVDNDLPFFIVPYDITIGTSLKFKYEFFEKTFAMMLSVSQENKLKWYQTSWFSLIMTIIGVIISALTLGVGTAFTGLALSFVGQRLYDINTTLGDIFSLATFIYSFGGNIQQFLTNPNNLLQTVNFLSQNVARYNIEDKINELENLNEKQKEELNEYNKQKGLDIKYNPYDELHKLNNTLTDPLNTTWNSVQLGTVKLGW